MATDRAQSPLLPQMPASDTHQETVVLNDFGGVTFDERTRTTSKATQVRYTLSIKAEPILFNLSGLDLGRKPALAILELIRKQHAAIAQMAKPSTIARRRAAAKELASGGSSRLSRNKMVDSGDLVRRRYVAARTKNDPPGTSARWGSDSNILFNGWFVRQNPTEASWTINVPANRFDPSTFSGGLAALQTFIGQLVEKIPALRGDVLGDQGFVRAVAESTPVKVLGETWFDRLRNKAGVPIAVIRGGLRVLRAAGL